MNAGEAIRCEQLTKRYGKFVGLDRLDLAVPEGSIFGFLGPNGAGKTTTVKLLTGLSSPTKGTAWVAGGAVDRHSRSFRARIGYLPEEPAFYNWMSGLEFLTHIGRLFRLGDKAAAARAEELLDQVGLHECARRRIGGYSRGMRQRLGIAQALVNHPHVLFLDEPCSALDPIGRKDVLTLIQAMSGQTTVFMSTHILSDVERVCNQVAVIDNGRLVTCAGVEELRARFARPIFELQFAEKVDGLAKSIAALPWVTKVETANVDSLRVMSSDPEVARRQLPSIMASSGLTLVRYEVVAPTLEEIFVSLVHSDKSEGGGS